MALDFAHLQMWLALCVGGGALYVCLRCHLASCVIPQKLGVNEKLHSHPIATWSLMRCRPSASSSTESSSTRWPSIPALSWPRLPTPTSSTTPTRVTAISSFGACTRDMVRQAVHRRDTSIVKSNTHPLQARSSASAPTASPSTPTRPSRKSTASAPTSARPSSTTPLSTQPPTPTTPATRTSTPASAASSPTPLPRAP